jgi:hypothetical protein
MTDIQLKPKLHLPGLNPAAPAKPEPVKKLPAEDPGTAAERNLIGFAIKQHRLMRFTWLDGSSFDAIPLNYGRYSIEVEGDHLVFKHALREMQLVRQAGA